MTSAELLQRIAVGESQTLEFKASFDKACIATLLAFANAQGGTVLVGVSDAGLVLGKTVGKETLNDWLGQIKSATSPSLIPDISAYTKGASMKKNATMKQNADRFVHAIFCDDIRQEIGNKVSFMGCYQGELFVPFVPFVPLMLPKLCVQVTVSTTKERPITSLTVRLDQGATQLAVIEVPSGDFERSIPSHPEDTTRWSASIGVMLTPFTITGPGELRVVVITEEGEMPGPRLRIKVMPQAEDLITSAQSVAASAATPKATSKKVATRNASTKKIPGKH